MQSAKTIDQQLDEQAARVAKRPTYLYDVPEGVDPQISEIGLVEVTAEEELMAAKAAGREEARIAYELVKRSLCSINGHPVSTVDGSADKAWDEMGAKLRQLVLGAYSEIHNPQDGAAAAFLKSRRVKLA